MTKYLFFFAQWGGAWPTRTVELSCLRCLRLTLRSLGGLGLLLANAFFAALFWLFASWGWLPIDRVDTISWLGLLIVSLILATGMTWTHHRPR